MKAPRFALVTALLLLGLVRSPAAETPVAKPGYKVVVAVTINEQGVTENPRIVTSDDPSAEFLLNRAALKMAESIKQPPRQKEGKPIRYTVQAPFVFPVDGDEGPTPESIQKPSIKNALKPTYPESLAAQGEVGAAIVEIVVDVEGKISTMNVLRSTHPEFAEAATTALRQWEFVPGKKDGAAAETRWRVAVNFATTERETGWQWKIPPRPSLGNYTVIHVIKPAEPAGAPPSGTNPPAPEPPGAEKK